MKLLKNPLYCGFFYEIISSFEKRSSSFFIPFFSNLISAFLSPPLPSIEITLPFPNLSCITIFPTTNLESKRLDLTEDDLILIKFDGGLFSGFLYLKPILLY